MGRTEAVFRTNPERAESAGLPIHSNEVRAKKKKSAAGVMEKL